MSVSTTFDLLLRGGRVIDPASGIDGIKDVAIRNGKVAAVQSDILPTSAREVLDVTDKIVLPGLIDTHAHVYQYVTGRFGVNADIDATVKAATANRDLVRGIKAHAEIGGFARWGIRVIEMAAEIGRRADLPVYVHFGQLWGLPESGTNGEDVDTILERVIPLLREGDVLAHPFTRHAGPA